MNQNIESNKLKYRRVREELDKGNIVHLYPDAEEKIHYSGNDMIELAKGEHVLCWCAPEVNDYSEANGGVLVTHRQVTWQ